MPSNTFGVILLFYQCVEHFINLSQLPFQNRKFRDDITKTEFRYYPRSRSSVITQDISFVAVQLVEQASKFNG